MKLFPQAGRLVFGGNFKWQPTTTSHDPNPPLPLEDPAVSNFGLDEDDGLSFVFVWRN